MKNISKLLFLPIFVLLITSCGGTKEEVQDLCSKSCNTGFVLNEDTCNCEKAPCTKTCDTGFIINEDNCECEKEPCKNTCESGFVLNSDTCECEKVICTKTCDAGFILNEDTCECEKEPCTKTCDAGFELNSDTCECEEIFVANVVNIDASDITVINDWKIKTTIADYTGNGYIVWEGPAQFWKDASKIGTLGKLTYKVNIPRAGTYLFQWRSYIAKMAATNPATEHNDSWLRIPDANNFYAQKGTSILYPKGSGKTPNPAGENGNGFFKGYMNTVNKWTNGTYTSDHNSHGIYATFNEAKEYTIEISPRSNYHAIDSFKLIEQEPNN